MENYKKERIKRKKGEELFWIGGMNVCEMDTRIGLSFLKGLDIDNSVSELILSNNLSYNLYSFLWESVYLGKDSLLKIAYVEWKIIFPCIWHIKW